MPPHRNSTQHNAGPTRRLWARATLIVAVAALAGAPATVRADTEPVKISAQTDRASGRLVLEWRSPVTYTVTRAGDYILVRFSQPITGELALVRGTLNRYLAEMRLTGGGRVLILRLSGEPEFTHRLKGHAVVLTWIGAPPPARRRPAENPTDSDPNPPLPAPNATEAPPVEARRVETRPFPEKSAAPQPIEAKPLQPKPVETRSAEPRRLVARPIASRTPRSPSESTELPPAPSMPRLAAPARPTVAPEPARQLFSGPGEVAPQLQSPRLAGESFPARPAERPGFAHVQPNAPARPSATLGTPVHGEEIAPSRPSPAPVASRERTSPLHQAEEPATPPPAPRAEEGRPAPILVKAPDSGPAPVRPAIRVAPAARPAPDAPIEPPVMPAISPTLTVASDGAETRIAVAWPEPMGAAVFRYGDNVWMVFSRREPFDVKLAQRLLGPGVEKLTRIDHPQATILVARVAKDIRAQIQHERNVWTTVLKRDTAPVTLPEVKLAISRGTAEQVAVPLSGAEAPIRVTVPEIGSTLFIVPSRAAAAVAGARDFVTFRLVPAVQGALIEAVADGIGVETERAAITVRRSGGLLLSNGTPATQAGQ